MLRALIKLSYPALGSMAKGDLMTTDQILAVGRVTERLLICLFSGLSLVLGWNLFRAGVLDQQSASAQARGWRIELKRVGPGVFFALFGSAVLAVSLHSPLTLGGEPGASAGQKQYNVSADPATAKQWVASLNTVLQIATPDKFQAPEKQALARSGADLTNLRNALVIKQFGSDRFSEYQKNKERLAFDPSALQPDERQRLEEVAGWMQATRNLE